MPVTFKIACSYIHGEIEKEDRDIVDANFC